MHLTIIGTGFVGVVSSAVFSSFGHRVYGLDIDVDKIANLNKGIIPFYEPGLEELVKEGLERKNLSFTTSYQEAISQSDIILIAVGTPSAADGQADLRFVFDCAKSMAPFLKNGAIVAIKSTVPPGTNQKVREIIQANGVKAEFFLASLPEFLKEGTAVEDTLHPDRVIIGSQDAPVVAVLKELHKPLEANFVVMKPESAQMCKYTANSYLATRITFINQIANLCEVNGADIYEVIEGIGADRRIGRHYWYPGLGYGGSCFPKDVKELAAYARAIHQPNNLMVTIDQLNDERIPMLIKKFDTLVGGLKDKHVTLLGLSFKPNTDDLREAPSVKLVPLLAEAGAKISGYDPMANVSARKILGSNIQVEDSLDQALNGADVVLLLIEWPQLISMDLHHMSTLVKPHAAFIDTRDQYKRTEVEAVGLTYIGIGV